MGVTSHVFLGLPAAKPRVWVDLSSAESKRAGLAMHSPGRKVLKWAVKILGWFAWLPIERIVRGPVRRFDELDGHEVIEKAVGNPIEYLTLYMGNDSAKTKLTALVKVFNAEVQRRRERRDWLIVKLGRTLEAAEAIKNEVTVLNGLEKTKLARQVPRIIGDVGHDGIWTWSAQSVLPRGNSPVHLQKEHRAFLDELMRLGISHGDFTPWNCSIVGGKLYVWDWEDARPWVDGKDASWFVSQTTRLLKCKNKG